MWYDLVIIGGGINGCGCAADAAMRGLSVLLCEQNDLASETSSKSSKLIHGGLRYLEQYQFKLESAIRPILPLYGVTSARVFYFMMLKVIARLKLRFYQEAL